MLDDLPDDDEPEKKAEKETPWQTRLRRKANGSLESAEANASLIANNDKRLKGRIGWNEFKQQPVCFKPIRDPRIPELCSPPVERRDKKHGRMWLDADDLSVKLLMSNSADSGGYEVEFLNQAIKNAVLSAGMNNPIHPVKDFIYEQHETWKKKGCPTGELERLAIDYLGCPDTPFHRESARMFIIAAVARIFEPGCKFDQMVILQGATGARKSAFFRYLFSDEFFGDPDIDLENTGRVIEGINGLWVVEMAEMKIAKKADSNTLKRILSTVSDTYRLAYASRPWTFHRQCVFVGTSNEDDYLADPTSARRYWVWLVNQRFNEENPINTDKLARRRWAIFGEAYQAYLDMRAEQPHGDLILDLRSAEARRERDKIAESSRKQTVTEIVTEVIEEWLDTPRPADEVLVDKDGMTLDGYEGDETPMVRAMVTAQEVYEQLRHHPVLQAFHRLDMRTFGKALGKVTGWQEIGRVRRHGKPQASWYGREGVDGPLWVPAPEDDLIG
jgi:predicted P-loop ATPase